MNNVPTFSFGKFVSCTIRRNDGGYFLAISERPKRANIQTPFRIHRMLSSIFARFQFCLSCRLDDHPSAAIHLRIAHRPIAPPPPSRTMRRSRRWTRSAHRPRRRAVVTDASHRPTNVTTICATVSTICVATCTSNGPCAVACGHRTDAHGHCPSRSGHDALTDRALCGLCRRSRRAALCVCVFYPGRTEKSDGL
jgi:hypothetical protein